MTPELAVGANLVLVLLDRPTDRPLNSDVRA